MSLPLFLILTENSLAQPPQRRVLPDSSQIAAMVDTLSTKLTLSDSLKNKVHEIYIASFEKIKIAIEKNRSDFRKMRNARREINEKRDIEIKALLNDEQKIEYDKFLQKQREQFQRRGRRRR